MSVSDDKTQVRIASGNLAIKGDKGVYTGQVIDIDEALTIGRDPSCDLVIGSNLVSRKHATLTNDGGTLELIDNNSSNGSFVNGIKVARHRLNAGDVITFDTEEFSVVFKPEDKIEAELAPDSDATVIQPAGHLGSQSETTVMEAISVPSAPAQSEVPEEDNLKTQVSFVPEAPQDAQQTMVTPASELSVDQDAQQTMVSAPAAGSVQAPPAMKPAPTAAVPAAKVVELVGRMEPVAGRVFTLTKSLLTVGRSPFNDIILKTDSVSSHHAEIECQDGCWLVRDLYSSNGTYVNGVRIEEQEVVPGDILMFGELAMDFDPANKDDSKPSVEPVAPVAPASNTALIIGAAVGGFIVAMLAAYFLFA